MGGRPCPPDGDRLVRRGRHQLLAPDFLYAEAGHALWQKTQRGSLKPDEARQIRQWIVLPAAPIAGGCCDEKRARQAG